MAQACVIPMFDEPTVTEFNLSWDERREETVSLRAANRGSEDDHATICVLTFSCLMEEECGSKVASGTWNRRTISFHSLLPYSIICYLPWKQFPTTCIWPGFCVRLCNLRGTGCYFVTPDGARKVTFTKRLSAFQWNSCRLCRTHLSP
jgi:hypothetical protein